ncbi:hypothetical protein A9Q86_04645 [Flavobacteriales bacterium 33_180_T64]|nr:hypothetical protein A9Q86_04645 [Flavobacteriales bacterium 33_180_T64]
MRKTYGSLGIVMISFLLSCNSPKEAKTHSHNGQSSHAHNDYFGSYDLVDDNYGTNTKVTVTAGKRVMITNALPNHGTGNFPRKGNPNTISAQKRTYTFPMSPKYTGKAQWIREPGVALNGVKFEPGTAEVVVCDTGENYRVEAFQDVINLGLDFNNAHVQPTGAYHYHGSPTALIENFDTGEDLVHIGFAHDGFPIYFSKKGTYKSSYNAVEGNRKGEDCTYENPMHSMDVSVGGHHDGTFTSDFEYVAGSGDLDECNGITIDGEYMYLVTDTFPYVSRCLMGEVAQKERQGPPRQQQGGRGERSQDGQMNVTQLFEHMDTNKDGQLSKQEVKGPLSNNFSEIDINDDGFLSKEEIEKVLKSNKRGSQNGRQ